MSYDMVYMWWCYNHRIKFIIFCIINSNTFYILFYKWTTWWKHLRDIGASPNIFWLLSELMRMHWNSIFNMFFLMTSFHCLILLFFLVTFPICRSCLQLILVSTDVGAVLFVLDLHMKYTVEVVLLCGYMVWLAMRWDDSSSMCRTVLVVSPLHSCWWLRIPLEYEVSF